MSGLEVVELDPARSGDRRTFVGVPFDLAASVPAWQPGLRRLHADLVNPRRNPFWRERRGSFFVCRRGGQVVGRMAVVDPGQVPGRPGAAVVAFPDFVDDESVFQALLGAVSRRAVERGAASLFGPMNPNIHHDVGVQTSGHELRNAVFMGYQPPYYTEQFERAGFERLVDFEAWDLWRDTFLEDGRLRRLVERVERKPALVVRHADLSRFDEELRLFHRLYSGAFSDHWAFAAPSWQEFEFLAADLKHVLRPQMTLVAEWEGEPVGFVLGIPDFYQILPRATSGRLTPWFAFRTWRRWRDIDEVRVMITGVLPEFRRHGIHLPLFYRVATEIFELGFRGGEISWVLTENDPMAKALPLLGARRTKTYRIYERPLHQ